MDKEKCDEKEAYKEGHIMLKNIQQNNYNTIKKNYKINIQTNTLKQFKGYITDYEVN